MPSLLIALGLVFGIYFQIANLVFYIVVGVILAIFIVYRFGFKKALYFFVSLLIGFLYVFLRKIIGANIEFESIKGMVVESKENYFIIETGLGRYYINQPNHQYEIFDYVRINGSPKPLSFVSYESRFDFKTYLETRGIYSEISINEIETIIRFPLRTNAFRSALKSGLSTTTIDYLDAYIFGRPNYDSDALQFASNFNLTNLFSLSGLFLYSFSRFIEWLIELKFSKRVSQSVSVSVIFIFFIFTFFKLSILRLLIFRLLSYVNNHYLKGRFNRLEIISFSVIIIVMINPYSIFDPAFYLSYLLILTLFFFRDVFMHKRKVFRYALILLGVTILLLPYNVNVAHSFSPLNILFQPLFLLLTYPAFYFSFLSLFRIPFDWYFNFLNSFVNNFASFVRTFNLQIYASSFTHAQLLVYYSSFFLSLLAIQVRHKIFISFATLCFLVSTIANFIPLETLLNKSSVTFINVGQGDSTLIRYKHKNVLIDTGGHLGFDIASEVLIPYFKKEKIYHIDYLIITHHDFDHEGGVNSLIENFKVKNYIDTKASFPLTIDDLTINNLNLNAGQYEDENTNSLVLSFNLNNKDYLIMGDAPKVIEHQIIETYPYLECDILKVGHHGSNTSTSEEFISFLRPNDAVISCGKNNRYRHPHDDVLSILARYQVNIYRTDIQGSIKIGG